MILFCINLTHLTVLFNYLFIDGLMHMARAAIRDHTRVQEGAGVSFGRSGKWAFHERTITKSLRDLERGAISVSRFLHYAVRFFHLEGISNYVDEDFEEGWDEEFFNDEAAFDEEEAFYSPPGKYSHHNLSKAIDVSKPPFSRPNFMYVDVHDFEFNYDCVVFFYRRLALSPSRGALDRKSPPILYINTTRINRHLGR